jgi:hypothetical protein
MQVDIRFRACIFLRHQALVWWEMWLHIISVLAECCLDRPSMHHWRKSGWSSAVSDLLSQCGPWEREQWVECGVSHHNPCCLTWTLHYASCLQPFVMMFFYNPLMFKHFHGHIPGMANLTALQWWWWWWRAQHQSRVLNKLQGHHGTDQTDRLNVLLSEGGHEEIQASLSVVHSLF